MNLGFQFCILSFFVIEVVEVLVEEVNIDLKLLLQLFSDSHRNLCTF